MKIHTDTNFYNGSPEWNMHRCKLTVSVSLAFFLVCSPLTSYLFLVSNNKVMRRLHSCVPPHPGFSCLLLVFRSQAWWFSLEVWCVCVYQSCQLKKKKHISNITHWMKISKWFPHSFFQRWMEKRASHVNEWVHNGSREEKIETVFLNWKRYYCCEDFREDSSCHCQLSFCWIKTRASWAICWRRNNIYIYLKKFSEWSIPRDGSLWEVL